MKSTPDDDLDNLDVPHSTLHLSDEEEELDLEEAEDILHHLLPPGSVSAIDTHVNSPIPSGCPVVHDYVKGQSIDDTSIESDCPIYGVQHHYPKGRYHPEDVHPLEEFQPEDAKTNPSQRASPGQPFWLPTTRTMSGIPRSGAVSDHHWVYPSQQMFWNAMVKKGWKESSAITPHVMFDLLLIHNAKNEQAWHEILKWETLHAHECTEPKLRSFGEGITNKLSPRAHIRSWLGYELPYDRHDWIVDRCGTTVRYVIDYYEGEHEPHSLEFSRLDVRPAMDSLVSINDRMKVACARWLHEFFDRPIFDNFRHKVDDFIERRLWKKHSAFEKHIAPSELEKDT